MIKFQHLLSLVNVTLINEIDAPDFDEMVPAIKVWITRYEWIIY